MNARGAQHHVHYGPLSASVSLIRDESLEVRRAAAARIVSGAGEFHSKPSRLLGVLVSESDPQVVVSIINAFSKMVCPLERCVPVLISLLNDPRGDVSVAAGFALGALGEQARAAFIPMAADFMGSDELRRREGLLNYLAEC